MSIVCKPCGSYFCHERIEAKKQVKSKYYETSIDKWHWPLYKCQDEKTTSDYSQLAGIPIEQKTECPCIVAKMKLKVKYKKCRHCNGTGFVRSKK